MPLIPSSPKGISRDGSSLQRFNNVAAGFMPAIYASVKGAPTPGRRRATSFFLLLRINSHGRWNTIAMECTSFRIEPKEKATRLRVWPLDCYFTRPIRYSGQNLTHALPTIRLRSSGPQTWLSLLSLRLSPIMNSLPGGTLYGPNT